jgi:hypothetical protein
MTMEKEEAFPETEAWVAGLPKVRKDFSTSSLRKTTGSEASPSGEYVHFAGLDFSNLGK